ncbi:hypothetical protein GGS21DRAFT_485909 [Xylaria nigripes]|nr:hypothetical protein GGS21DRAFT_485909 [Xylaria nigripes]
MDDDDGDGDVTFRRLNITCRASVKNAEVGPSLPRHDSTYDFASSILNSSLTHSSQGSSRNLSILSQWTTPQTFRPLDGLQPQSLTDIAIDVLMVQK